MLKPDPIKQNPVVLLLIGLSLFTPSCIDEVTSTPPCFYQGMSQDIQNLSYELNVCCEPGKEGNLFCADYFKELGYAPAAPLSYCTDSMTCILCDIGKNCECLNSYDCESDEICKRIDDPDQCRAAGLELVSRERKCSLCQPRP